MSASWNFYSFDSTHFEHLLGSGSESHADTLATSLANEDFFDFDDPDISESVARRVIMKGFFYDSATDEEQDVLDCIPRVIFNVSGLLSETLDARPESSEGFHINVVEEMHKRAARHCELRLLKLFDGGRRYGVTPTEHCDYIIFSPTEVSELLSEAQQVVDVEAGWSHPDFRPMVEKELIEPLQKTVDANRGLAAFFP
jgi:hypothetical protein